jgi:Fungal rhodopsin domain
MADSLTEYNGYQLVAVVITFLVLTYISVGLRCFVRIRITRAFAIDDWLMLVAQLIFTISCAFILEGIRYGIGRHNSELSVNNEIEGLKVICLMFLGLAICSNFQLVSSFRDSFVCGQHDVH